MSDFLKTKIRPSWILGFFLILIVVNTVRNILHNPSLGFEGVVFVLVAHVWIACGLFIIGFFVSNLTQANIPRKFLNRWDILVILVVVFMAFSMAFIIFMAARRPPGRRSEEGKTTENWTKQNADSFKSILPGVPRPG